MQATDIFKCSKKGKEHGYHLVFSWIPESQSQEEDDDNGKTRPAKVGVTIVEWDPQSFKTTRRTAFFYDVPQAYAIHKSYLEGRAKGWPDKREDCPAIDSFKQSGGGRGCTVAYNEGGLTYSVRERGEEKEKMTSLTFSLSPMDAYTLALEVTGFVERVRLAESLADVAAAVVHVTAEVLTERTVKALDVLMEEGAATGPSAEDKPAEAVQPSPEPKPSAPPPKTTTPPPSPAEAARITIKTGLWSTALADLAAKTDYYTDKAGRVNAFHVLGALSKSGWTQDITDDNVDDAIETALTYAKESSPGGEPGD